MRIVRLGDVGVERWAVMVDDDTAAYVAPGSDAFSDVLQRATQPTGETVAVADVRVGAPLVPGKIVCIGANYAEHVRESGMAIPEQPIMFLKTPDTVVGPYDDVVLPPDSVKSDWEVELGVVIGAETYLLASESEALGVVAGYVLANDLSEREYQLERGGTWDKGKNCPTFCPLGPWVLTADEVSDPQQVKLGLDVNGQAFQNASTSDMIFGVAHLIWYVSQYMRLYPGDVIITGTPVGVGMGQNPQRYLDGGDTMRVWGEGLGEQRSNVVRFSGA